MREVRTSWSLLVPGADANANGLPDDWEWFHFDALGQNPLGDPDSDGLTNRDEFALALNPKSKDTDGDAMPENWEIQHGIDPRNASDASADPDADGLSNFGEYVSGNNPNLFSTDGTGVSDWDRVMGIDVDGDGLTGIEEITLGTNQFLADTNGDGIADGLGHPLVSSINMDHDGDGIPNAAERLAGTDPFKADTDGDGVPDNTDALPLNAYLLHPIAANPGDTVAPVVTLLQPSNAIKVQ